MSSIEQYSSTSSQLSNRTSRALSRALANIQAGSAVQVARIEAAVQRHGAVVDGVTAVTGRAMQHVALIASAEVQIAQAVPHASGRLAALADAHSLAMQSTVMETARALGRLA